jgi:hypothetical protein
LSLYFGHFFPRYMTRDSDIYERIRVKSVSVCG